MKKQGWTDKGWRQKYGRGIGTKPLFLQPKPVGGGGSLGSQLPLKGPLGNGFTAASGTHHTNPADSYGLTTLLASTSPFHSQSPTRFLPVGHCTVTLEWRKRVIFHLAPFQWSLFRRGQAEVSWEVKRMLRGARAGNTQGPRTTREAEQSRSKPRIQQETPPHHTAAPQPTAAQSQAGSPRPEARSHLAAQLAQLDL